MSGKLLLSLLLQVIVSMPACGRKMEDEITTYVAADQQGHADQSRIHGRSSSRIDAGPFELFVSFRRKSAGAETFDCQVLVEPSSESIAVVRLDSVQLVQVSERELNAPVDLPLARHVQPKTPSGALIQNRELDLSGYSQPDSVRLRFKLRATHGDTSVSREIECDFVRAEVAIPSSIH